MENQTSASTTPITHVQNQPQTPSPVQASQSPVPPINNPAQENKPKPSRWPMTLIIFGILGIVSSIIFGYGEFMMIGELNKTYKQLGTTINKPIMYTGTAVLLIIPFFQTIYGFYARKKQKIQGFLTKKQNFISAFLFFLPLIFSLFFLPYYMYSIMHPLYNQMLDINYYNTSQQRITPSPIPTKATDETANSDLIGASWKTYENNKLSFSVKYPAILRLTESTKKYYNQKAFGISLRNYTPEEEFRHTDAISITISIISVDKEIPNLQKWLEDISIGPRIIGDVGVRIGKSVPFKTSNIEGLEYTDGQESVWRNIAFQKNKKVYIFTLNPTTETGGSYDENKNAVKIFDQILSTFKFLK